MKKFILTLFIFALFAGCTDEYSKTCKCYRFNYTMGNDVKVERYAWTNEENAKWQKQRYEKLGYSNVSYKHELLKNTFADCWDSDTATHICGKIPGNTVN
ncbi:MAG: hypothetical protein [Wendovervirus sonii]|uniref:Lipoprotein n=1 Tax=phage Lak_Megaphage_Sonny TaxID=3109229 RepID=A0ABZ0Z405_9CAUD|nr:MAG: hypothetical protein [phage Lak_Megaphage_Sonny]